MRKKYQISIWAILIGMNSVILYLHRIAWWEILYAFLLSVFLVVIFAGMESLHMKKKKTELELLCKDNTRIEEIRSAEKKIGQLELAYQRCIGQLIEEKRSLIIERDHRMKDMMEYYSLWAHQIKTPISGMRLILQGIGEKSSEEQEIENELFRIEQYVEMVLSYLRIGSDSHDFVFSMVDLHAVVRQVLKKYARQFYRSKLTVDLEDFDQKVLSDEKWLGFVIGQILSNALKYTKQGKITIGYEEPSVLVIADTGIGIAAEDLPRILENGYTGYNGRSDKKSTGIGLYLCDTILKKMGNRITIESELGKGTKVRLHLEKKEFEIE